MILAQNLRQLLNGSRIIVALILLFSLASCGLFKKTSDSDRKDKVIIEDIESIIDTLDFVKVPEEDLIPIREDEKTDKEEDLYAAFKKEKYNVSLFIPFDSKNLVLNSTEANYAVNLRFVNYYAGIKLALEDLESENLNLNVNVYDSERSEEMVRQKLQYSEVGQSDIIIGPYNREGLQATATFGKENNIAVISPWLASTRVTENNPFYVQLRPSLSSHYFKMLSHIYENFEREDIVLIGRDLASDKNRFKYFQSTYTALSNQSYAIDPISEFTVLEDSLIYGDNAFGKLFSGNSRKAIIIPNWDYNDEDFIYSCLRRINVEKGDTEVYVYGMPILYDSEKMDFDFYRNLNIRVVLSEFTDWNDQRVSDFERKYYEQYGDLPTSDAYEGYDMMRFIGNNLKKYGINFHLHLEEDESRYLQTAFEIERIYNEGDEKFEQIKYLENKHLDLIQYVGNKFIKID